MTEKPKRIVNSYSESEHYDYVWKIHNFSRQLDGVKSEVFYPSSIIPLQYYLELNFLTVSDPKGEVNSKYVISLVKPSGGKILNNLRVIPKLEVLSSRGSFLNSSDGNVYIVRDNERIELISQKLPYAYRGNVLSKDLIVHFHPLSDNILVIKCSLELFGHLRSTSNKSLITKYLFKNQTKLTTDFKALYDSKFHRDLKIHIGEDILYAHQRVLATRSPVFKCMLEKNWQESKSKTVTITDVSVEIFEKLIKYVYTAEMEDKSFSTVTQLYILADKYAISDLLEECSEMIGSNLSVKSVYQVMSLAYLVNDENLKAKVVNFVASHFMEITLQLEWINVLKKYPELASEIIASLASIFGIPDKKTVIKKNKD